MNTPKPSCLHLGPILAFALAWLLATAGVHAQSTTGSIQGRIYNPATKLYVSNAEVRVEGTNLVTASEDDGSYRIPNVPAGPATVSISYTGYTADPAKLNVTAGQVAVRDFELTSTFAPTSSAGGGETIVLQAFTVSSDREGNAKAIMQQKRAMNITTTVASDIFGDVTDGNVGEFLKMLPGVDIDYVESETRGPRLGGMDAQYTAVTFDGTRLASADANRTGDLGRATSFEAFSINSIESIEIYLTTSPDMDADAPAGAINMKTKRAFDRKGRRIGYNFSLNLNSEEFSFSKTYGPGGTKSYKARPNFSLDYSDVFLSQRLGIVAAISHVDSYTEQYRHNITFNLNPTVADPRPMVATQIQVKDGNKNTAKDTYTMTADFKATPRLVLSNTLIYNYALGQFYNRQLDFNSAANNANVNIGRSTVLGDGVLDVRTNGLASNTSRNSNISGGNASKRTITFTLAPKFEYKLESWTVDGAAAYSRSDNNYEGLEKGHGASELTNAITSDFTASRPNVNSHEWTIQQTSGADWFNLYNRGNPRLTNEARYARTEIYSGELNAKWVTPLKTFPTSLKFGGRWTEEGRKNGNETSYYTWQYVGPGGNILNPNGTITSAGSWGDYPNRNFFSTGTTNILTVKDLTGQVRPQSIPRPDDNAIADLYHAHPEYFVNVATADNYYNAFIAPRRNTVQTVPAAYGLADIRVTTKLKVLTGVRWEKTESTTRDFDPRSKAEMLAAGYALNTAGRATTIAGYHFQYLSQPLVSRRTDYDNYFPMISAKYNFTKDLQFQAGVNKAIARPPTDSLGGAWIINEDTHTVTSPNPSLLPEYSTNYAARLSYFFEPAGKLEVTGAQHNLRNSRETRLGTAEEFGVADDPQFFGYQFQSTYNVARPVCLRSLNVAYNQSFPGLPEVLRGTNLNLSYSRTYADIRKGGLTPKLFTSSLSYRYKRFSGRFNAVWRDNTPLNATYGVYRRHDIKYDVGGEFRLTSKLSLFFQGRNILNTGQTWLQTPTANVEGQGAAVSIYENYGANWNFGIKGTF